LLFLITFCSVFLTTTFQPQDSVTFAHTHGTSAAACVQSGCRSTDLSMALALQNRCRTAARGGRASGRFGGRMAVPVWRPSGRNDAVLDVDHLRRRGRIRGSRVTSQVARLHAAKRFDWP
jgi:hypothetical protein